jgi:ATP-dependent 26S proteasome regulatory subunit
MFFPKRNPERINFTVHRRLFVMLAEMDGIEEKTAIVTVATTNCFEILDNAQCERPLRFYRIFRFSRPGRKKTGMNELPIRIEKDTIQCMSTRNDGMTFLPLIDLPIISG